MPKETLRDRFIRFEVRQEEIFNSVKDIKENFNRHYQEDRQEFTSIRNDIKNLTKYALSISGITAIIGYFMGKQ